MTQRDLFAIDRSKNGHERFKEIMESVEIENAIMQVFIAAPDREFEPYHLFDAVRRFDATDCVGHILGRLARAGKLTEENRYFGSMGQTLLQPPLSNYLGFTTVYKLRTA